MRRHLSQGSGLAHLTNDIVREAEQPDPVCLLRRSLWRNVPRMYVVSQEQLPFSVIAREFVGEDHGGVGICVIFVDAAPGEGPSLHRHPYPEVFINQEGEALFVAGDEERMVGPGEVVVVPAGTPHKFRNVGDGRLRQIDIHVSPRFSTEWLDEEG